MAGQPGADLRAEHVLENLRPRIAPHLLPAEVHVVRRLATRPDGWLERGTQDHAAERGLGALLIDALTQ